MGVGMEPPKVTKEWKPIACCHPIDNDNDVNLDNDHPAQFRLSRRVSASIGFRGLPPI